jgi:hypothetical protein
MAQGKTLTVLVGADVSQLTRQLGKGRASLRDFANGSASLGDVMKANLGPAMIGAGIALAGLATAMAIDGVKAAIQEEKELAKLSTTLNNLGFGAATDGINQFIDDMQFATGVSDTQLRPSFERLIISTNDIATAQKSLQLAMDIAAGTNKTVEQTSSALAKAYDGNYGALTKLNTGLDKAVVKTGDMDLITKELAKTFDGQASAAADTFDGRLKRLGIAGDELKESFGTGFLAGLDKALGGTGEGMDGLIQTTRDLQPALMNIGMQVGNMTAELLLLVQGLGKAIEYLDSFGIEVNNTGNRISLLTGTIGIVKAAWDSVFQNNDKKLSGIDLLTNNGKFGPLNRMNALMEQMNGNTDANTVATTKASAAQKLLETRYQATLEVFNLAKGKLSDATRELEKWNSEIDTFISSTAGKIMSGLNIGAAFEAATSEAGKAAGLTTAKAFQEQMAKSLKFGGLLAKLKSSGAKDNLIQQVADVGPEAGVALAEDLIQSGLIPTLQSQLDQVQAEAATLAASLVPPFLLEGQSAARGAVAAALIEFQSAQTALEIAGKAAGKSFGAGLLNEIEKAIKAAQTALQNVQGGTGMSSAVGQDFTAYPGGSPLSAQEANMFDIAAYNANYAASLLSTGGDIDRVIRQSNNRNGWYEMPTVTPVLQ